MLLASWILRIVVNRLSNSSGEFFHYTMYYIMYPMYVRMELHCSTQLGKQTSLVRCLLC